jgi:ADP-heptose:LPS heptosyltransferase
MRAFAPDAAVDAQGNWKSAVIARAAGAPVAGFAASVRREPSSAVLCTIAVTPGPEARHVVEQNLALLPAVGIAAAISAPDARYLLGRPSPDAERFVAGRPRPFVVLHPGAGREDKCWGEERFARLAAALAERGLDSVISWGPGDETRAARLEALAPGAARAPLLDLPGLARLADASRLFVGGDTGPLHLADAVGARTLALFGPTDPQRNGPYGNRGGVVANMHAVPDADVIQRAFDALESGGPLTPGP